MVVGEEALFEGLLRATTIATFLSLSHVISQPVETHTHTNLVFTALEFFVEEKNEIFLIFVASSIPRLWLCMTPGTARTTLTTLLSPN